MNTLVPINIKMCPNVANKCLDTYLNLFVRFKKGVCQNNNTNPSKINRGAYVVYPFKSSQCAVLINIKIPATDANSVLSIFSAVSILHKPSID